MKDLINKLKDTHGLTDEQSHSILNTIKDYIKQKFPMIESAVDNLFHHNDPANTTSAGDTGSTEGSAAKGGSFLDHDILS